MLESEEEGKECWICVLLHNMDLKINIQSLDNIV